MLNTPLITSQHTLHKKHLTHICSLQQSFPIQISHNFATQKYIQFNQNYSYAFSKYAATILHTQSWGKIYPLHNMTGHEFIQLLLNIFVCKPEFSNYRFYWLRQNYCTHSVIGQSPSHVPVEKFQPVQTSYIPSCPHYKSLPIGCLPYIGLIIIVEWKNTFCINSWSVTNWFISN
jgi:hypothetical protein